MANSATAACPKCSTPAKTFIQERPVTREQSRLLPGEASQRVEPCGCTLTATEFEAACREYVDRR